MIMKLPTSLGAMIALAACFLVPTSVSLGQTDQACAGELLPTKFGQACVSHVDLSAITEADYGVVRLRFRPPPSLNDVIPDNSLRGSYLEGLVQRVAGQRVNSAVVLLEVRAVGPGLPAVAGPNGGNIGVPIAVVPLALYGFDNRNGVKFNEVQDFADRVIGPRLLLRSDQTIRARLKVSFSQENPASLLASLAPVVNAAAAFGGHGFVVDAFASPALIEDLTRIESILRSVNNVDADSDNWIDMNFEQGSNRLVYNFQLNPRTRRGRDVTPRPQGELVLTLERRPSLFTNEVLAGGPPGRALPDYRTGGRLDSQATDRIWVDGRVAPGVSPASYVRESDGLTTALELFQSADTPVPTFDTVCRSLRQSVAQFNLSIHDRTAIFWAAFVQGDSARRYEIQEVACIQRDRQLWESYQFALPEVGPPPPPAPSREERDDWIVGTVAPALSQQDPTERYRLLRRLFRSRVLTDIGPNTLFAEGEEPVPNTEVDVASLLQVLRPLRVGCRFEQQEPGASPDLPRVHVLARDPSNDRLMVVTVDYGGRATGASRVEVTGLRVRPPGDDDWEAIAATPGLPPRCQRDNMAYAPVDPPAGLPVNPTPESPSQQ